MRKVLLAVVVLLAPLGCMSGFEPPLVAGKIVLTLGAQQFFLDTGNNGETAVSFDEDEPGSWYTDCGLRDGEFQVMIHNEAIREKKGFWGVNIRAAIDVPQEDANVFVSLGEDSLSGVCQLKHKTTRERDPYEGELSAAACIVKDLREDPDGLQEARFDAFIRARQCFLINAENAAD
ncbi:uncharacterized protein SOCE26_069860 [Sorangium cellulosum]|uniref:Secreted protein n=1 Tax=Sorangium cellulosum TaxID=56 RepID=A0A2L0F1Q7_SORCE|nr:hypothetical protein [Sorangium cellulosum]AUX45494.1 uncharacterized protein SOCE26_069860 [Sorangium cellulosum]